MEVQVTGKKVQKGSVQIRTSPLYKMQLVPQPKIEKSASHGATMITGQILGQPGIIAKSNEHKHLERAEHRSAESFPHKLPVKKMNRPWRTKKSRTKSISEDSTRRVRSKTQKSIAKHHDYSPEKKMDSAKAKIANKKYCTSTPTKRKLFQEQGVKGQTTSPHPTHLIDKREVSGLFKAAEATLKPQRSPGKRSPSVSKSPELKVEKISEKELIRRERIRSRKALRKLKKAKELELQQQQSENDRKHEIELLEEDIRTVNRKKFRPRTPRILPQASSDAASPAAKLNIPTQRQRKPPVPRLSGRKKTIKQKSDEDTNSEYEASFEDDEAGPIEAKRESKVAVIQDDKGIIPEKSTSFKRRPTVKKNKDPVLPVAKALKSIDDQKQKEIEERRTRAKDYIAERKQKRVRELKIQKLEQEKAEELRKQKLENLENEIKSQFRSSLPKQNKSKKKRASKLRSPEFLNEFTSPEEDNEHKVKVHTSAEILVAGLRDTSSLLTIHQGSASPTSLSEKLHLEDLSVMKEDTTEDEEHSSQGIPMEENNNKPLDYLWTSSQMGVELEEEEKEDADSVEDEIEESSSNQEEQEIRRKRFILERLQSLQRATITLSSRISHLAEKKMSYSKPPVPQDIHLRAGEISEQNLSVKATSTSELIRSPVEKSHSDTAEGSELKNETMTDIEPPQAMDISMPVPAPFKSADTSPCNSNRQNIENYEEGKIAAFELEEKYAPTPQFSLESIGADKVHVRRSKVEEYATIIQAVPRASVKPSPTKLSMLMSDYQHKRSQTKTQKADLGDHKPIQARHFSPASTSIIQPSSFDELLRESDDSFRVVDLIAEQMFEKQKKGGVKVVEESGSDTQPPLPGPIEASKDEEPEEYWNSLLVDVEKIDEGRDEVIRIADAKDSDEMNAGTEHTEIKTNIEEATTPAEDIAVQGASEKGSIEPEKATEEHHHLPRPEIVREYKTEEPNTDSERLRASPASLAQQLLAEVDYQDSLTQAHIQLVEIEKAQALSTAQEETLDLAKRWYTDAEYATQLEAQHTQEMALAINFEEQINQFKDQMQKDLEDKLASLKEREEQMERKMRELRQSESSAQTDEGIVVAVTAEAKEPKKSLETSIVGEDSQYSAAYSEDFTNDDGEYTNDFTDATAEDMADEATKQASLASVVTEEEVVDEVESFESMPEEVPSATTHASKSPRKEMADELGQSSIYSEEFASESNKSIAEAASEEIESFESAENIVSTPSIASASLKQATDDGSVYSEEFSSESNKLEIAEVSAPTEQQVDADVNDYTEEFEDENFDKKSSIRSESQDIPESVQSSFKSDRSIDFDNEFSEDIDESTPQEKEVSASASIDESTAEIASDTNKVNEDPGSAMRAAADDMKPLDDSTENYMEHIKSRQHHEEHLINLRLKKIENQHEAELARIDREIQGLPEKAEGNLELEKLRVIRRNLVIAYKAEKARIDAQKATATARAYREILQFQTPGALQDISEIESTEGQSLDQKLILKALSPLKTLPKKSPQKKPAAVKLTKQVEGALRGRATSISSNYSQYSDEFVDEESDGEVSEESIESQASVREATSIDQIPEEEDEVGSSKHEDTVEESEIIKDDRIQDEVSDEMAEEIEASHATEEYSDFESGSSEIIGEAAVSGSAIPSPAKSSSRAISEEYSDFESASSEKIPETEVSEATIPSPVKASTVAATSAEGVSKEISESSGSDSKSVTTQLLEAELSKIKEKFSEQLSVDDKREEKLQGKKETATNLLQQKQQAITATIKKMTLDEEEKQINQLVQEALNLNVYEEIQKARESIPSQVEKDLDTVGAQKIVAPLARKPKISTAKLGQEVPSEKLPPARATTKKEVAVESSVESDQASASQSKSGSAGDEYEEEEFEDDFEEPEDDEAEEVEEVESISIEEDEPSEIESEGIPSESGEANVADHSSESQVEHDASVADDYGDSFESESTGAKQKASMDTKEYEHSNNSLSSSHNSATTEYKAKQITTEDSVEDEITSSSLQEEQTRLEELKAKLVQRQEEAAESKRLLELEKKRKEIQASKRKLEQEIDITERTIVADKDKAEELRSMPVSAPSILPLEAKEDATSDPALMEAEFQPEAVEPIESKSATDMEAEFDEDMQVNSFESNEVLGIDEELSRSASTLVSLDGDEVESLSYEDDSFASSQQVEDADGDEMDSFSEDEVLEPIATKQVTEPNVDPKDDLEDSFGSIEDQDNLLTEVVAPSEKRIEPSPSEASFAENSLDRSTQDKEMSLLESTFESLAAESVNDVGDGAQLGELDDSFMSESGELTRVTASLHKVGKVGKRKMATEMDGADIIDTAQPPQGRVEWFDDAAYVEKAEVVKEKHARIQDASKLGTEAYIEERRNLQSTTWFADADFIEKAATVEPEINEIIVADKFSQKSADESSIEQKTTMQDWFSVANYIEKADPVEVIQASMAAKELLEQECPANAATSPPGVREMVDESCRKEQTPEKLSQKQDWFSSANYSEKAEDVEQEDTGVIEESDRSSEQVEGHESIEDTGMNEKQEVLSPISQTLRELRSWMENADVIEMTEAPEMLNMGHECKNEEIDYLASDTLVDLRRWMEKVDYIESAEPPEASDEVEHEFIGADKELLTPKFSQFSDYTEPAERPEVIQEEMLEEVEPAEREVGTEVQEKLSPSTDLVKVAESIVDSLMGSFETDIQTVIEEAIISRREALKDTEAVCERAVESVDSPEPSSAFEDRIVDDLTEHVLEDAWKVATGILAKQRPPEATSQKKVPVVIPQEYLEIANEAYKRPKDAGYGKYLETCVNRMAELEAAHFTDFLRGIAATPLPVSSSVKFKNPGIHTDTPTQPQLLFDCFSEILHDSKSTLPLSWRSKLDLGQKIEASELRRHLQQELDKLGITRRDTSSNLLKYSTLNWNDHIAQHATQRDQASTLAETAALRDVCGRWTNDVDTYATVLKDRISDSIVSDIIHETL